MEGRAIARGEKGFEEAIRIWNAFVKVEPRAVWRCSSVADVVSALRWAKENGVVSVAVKGGGHNVGGLARGNSDSLCLSLEGMRDVVVDVQRKTVKCGGGCLASQVDGATAVHGLYVAGLGLISETGVGGLATGGGVGWLARRYGLAVDSMQSVDMVLADGTVLEGVSEEHEPELFFAVRGGGSNFGIVTSFTFRLVAVHHVFVRTLVFEEHIDQAMDAYVSLCAAAPNQVTALGFLSSESNLIDRFVVMVAWIPEEGSEDLVASEAAVKRASASMDDLCTFSMLDCMPLVDLQRRFDEGNRGGRRYYWKSKFLTSWEQVRDATKVAKQCLTQGAPSRGCSVEFVPFGGQIALNKNVGCFGHRDAVMEMHSICVWDDEASDAKCVGWSKAFGDRLGGGGAGNINILGPSQRSVETTKLAYGAHWERLVQAKRKYDPTNLFSCNHNIVP